MCFFFIFLSNQRKAAVLQKRVVVTNISSWRVIGDFFVFFFFCHVVLLILIAVVSVQWREIHSFICQSGGLVLFLDIRRWKLDMKVTLKLVLEKQHLKLEQIAYSHIVVICERKLIKWQFYKSWFFKKKFTCSNNIIASNFFDN